MEETGVLELERATVGGAEAQEEAQMKVLHELRAYLSRFCLDESLFSLPPTDNFYDGDNLLFELSLSNLAFSEIFIAYKMLHQKQLP